MTIPNISGVEWTLAHVELRGDWIYGFLKIGWFTWSSSAAFFYNFGGCFNHFDLAHFGRDPEELVFN